MPTPHTKKAFMEDAREQHELKFFKPDPKVPYPTIIFFGKRFAGKSCASMYAADLYNPGRWAAFCGTKETQDDWAEAFESRASVYGPDAKGRMALKRLLADQQRRARYYKKFLKKPFPKELTLGLEFDDVTASRDFRRSEILEDLFANGRHFKTVILISSQWPRSLSIACRSNADYLCCMHMAKSSAEIVYKEFINEPADVHLFLELLHFVTSQRDPVELDPLDPTKKKNLYYGLLFDNTTTSTAIEDLFKIFATPKDFDPSKVRLGTPEWREYNKAHFIDHELDGFAKEARKKARLERLTAYRAQQMARRARNGPVSTPELDYMSESSDDEDSKKSATSLQGKSGHTMRVRLPERENETLRAKRDLKTVQSQNQVPLRQSPYAALTSPLGQGQGISAAPTPHERQAYATQTAAARNPYEQQPSGQTYAAQSAYATQTPSRPNTYATQNPYEAQRAYTTQTLYRPNIYATQTPYEAQRAYATQTPYEAQRAYPTQTPYRPNTYATRTPYDAQRAYATQTPYEAQRDYLTQTPYRPNTYATQTPYDAQRAYATQTPYDAQRAYATQTPYERQTQSSQSHYAPQTTNATLGYYEQRPHYSSYAVRSPQTHYSHYSPTSRAYAPQTTSAPQRPFATSIQC